MSDSKRVERESLSFVDLPPRVIIEDILTFILHELDSSNKYSVFGTFKRDHLRNIWIIFKSIKVLPLQYLEDSQGFYLDPTRIRFLFFQSPQEVWMKRIIEKSDKMYQLSYMKIWSYRGDLKILNDLFSRNGCFPKLRSFHFRGGNCKGWEKSEVWRQLGSVCIDLYSNLPTSSDLKNVLEVLNGSTNLKRLEVEGVEFTEPLAIQLPALTHLTSMYSSGLNVVSIEKSLKHFRSFTIPVQCDDLKLVENVFRRCRNIESFDLFRYRLFPVDGRAFPWLFNTDINPLKHLKRVVLRGMKEAFGDDESKSGNYSFGENVERIHIDSCPNMGKTLFEQDYPKLRRLHLRGELGKFQELRSLPFSNHIRILKLECSQAFHEDLFKNSEWSNLEELEIERVPNLSGKKWSPMNKLESFEILGCDVFSNELFEREDTLQNLRRLRIWEKKYALFEITSNMLGTHKWKLPALKKLEIEKTARVSGRLRVGKFVPKGCEICFI